MDKKVMIIAGPNGAGKTTFAETFLPHEAACVNFINADLIARGLAPFSPETVAIRAGKIMLEEIARRVAAGQSFAFETTLSGMNFGRHISRWQKAGYRVELVFLSLPSPDLAVARVRARVLEGGHGIPEAVIRRRFDAGWRNFEQSYRRLVDSWELYDNSGDRPRLLASGGNR